MMLPAAYIPQTFAHLPVWDLKNEGLPRGLLQATVGVDLVISEADMTLSAAEYYDRILRFAETCLLDAIGHKTFSTFACVTFRKEGDLCRIDAWQSINSPLSSESA